MRAGDRRWNFRRIGWYQVSARWAEQRLAASCLSWVRLGSPIPAVSDGGGHRYDGICDSDVVEVSNLQRQLLHNRG